MCFEDFINNWELVELCHLTLDCFSQELLELDDDSDIEWNQSVFNSEWIVGKSAGGCGTGKKDDKFWTNPQFLITLSDVDENDNEVMSTVIISLMQKDSRIKRIKTKVLQSSEEFIQFRIFKVFN